MIIAVMDVVFIQIYYALTSLPNIFVPSNVIKSCIDI